LYIRYGVFEDLNVVSELAEANIASVAQDTAHLAICMIMIDNEAFPLATNPASATTKERSQGLFCETIASSPDAFFTTVITNS
jgi:hypothetical protein